MKSPVALASLTLAFLLGCSGAPESPTPEGTELEGTVASALTPCDGATSQHRRTFFTRNVNLGFAVEPAVSYTHLTLPTSDLV